MVCFPVRDCLRSNTCPGSLVAEPGETKVTLQWEESERASAYAIRRDGDLIAEEIIGVPYVDRDVEKGTTCSYAVLVANRTDSRGTLGDSIFPV